MENTEQTGAAEPRNDAPTEPAQKNETPIQDEFGRLARRPEPRREGARAMKTLDRRDCRILPLVLTGKWYRMIDSGEKTEEYRERTRYWQIRIRKWWYRYRSPHKKIVEFRFAYGPNAPRMAFEVVSVGTSFGFAKHPEWGEPTAPHYVIVLGERVALA